MSTNMSYGRHNHENYVPADILKEKAGCNKIEFMHSSPRKASKNFKKGSITNSANVNLN